MSQTTRQLSLLHSDGPAHSGHADMETQQTQAADDLTQNSSYVSN